MAALLGIVLMLVCIEAAAWLIACSQLENGFRGFVRDAAQQGWIAAFNLPARSGFPFAAELDVTQLAVTPDPSVFASGPTWSTERLRLRVALSRPSTLVLEPEGVQRVGLGAPPIPITSRRLELAIRLDGAAPPVATGTQLVAALPAGPVTIGAATLLFPPDVVIADLADIGLPRAPPVERLQARARLIQPFPRAPTPEASARAWRDAGGMVKVSDLALQWGPLAATGQAALGLDAQLQPEGQGTLEVTGLAPALDAMGRTGALPPGTVLAAKAVLALLAAPAHGGPVTLPFEIRAGVLIVARFPLLRLPPLVWS